MVDNLPNWCGGCDALALVLQRETIGLSRNDGNPFVVVRTGSRPEHAIDSDLSCFQAEARCRPAIDTHDHLFPFDRLPCIEETKRGRGVNLAGLWHNSYYRRFNPLDRLEAGMDFDEWWKIAKHDFEDCPGHELLPLSAAGVSGSLRRRFRPHHRRAGPRPRSADFRELQGPALALPRGAPSGPISS